MKRLLLLLFKIGLVFLICYAILTPEGSVRFAALRNGDFKSATTSSVSEISDNGKIAVYQLNKTIENKTGTTACFQTKNRLAFYWSTHLSTF